MSTIRDALDNLAEKVGVADTAANDMTIADKIDTITAAISTPSNSKDIADAVEKFGAAMPEYEATYDLLEKGNLILRGSLDKRGLLGRSQTWIRK